MNRVREGHDAMLKSASYCKRNDTNGTNAHLKNEPAAALLFLPSTCIHLWMYNYTLNMCLSFHDTQKHRPIGSNISWPCLWWQMVSFVANGLHRVHTFHWVTLLERQCLSNTPIYIYTCSVNALNKQDTSKYSVSVQKSRCMNLYCKMLSYMI